MEYIVVVQGGTGRQVSSQAGTCLFERKKKGGLGSLTMHQVYSYDWENSPPPQLWKPKVEQVTRPQEVWRGWPPEPILSPLIERTFTMGPLLPRLGPWCARFIPKGLGL